MSPFPPKKSRSRTGEDKAGDRLQKTRRGLPPKENIREIVEAVSPQNVHYKIIRTSETDGYDPKPASTKKRRPKT